MKRRLLPILMTLVLVCALPIWAAFVTSGDVTNPLVCTAGATSPEESAVDKLKLAISSGVDAQLTEDIEITQTLYVERSMTIDLNGHVLKMTGDGSVLRVEEGPHPVTLTITDSRPQNPHTGSYAGLPAGGVITGGKGPYVTGIYYVGGAVFLEKDTTLKLEGGTLTGNSGSSIYIGGATLVMSGGTITGETVGVYNNVGTFTMTGGRITGCSDRGVYVYNGNMTMSGTAYIGENPNARREDIYVYESDHKHTDLSVTGVVCSKRLLNQAVGKSLRTHNLKPKKGAQVMRKNEKITALYERLSRDDFGIDDDQQRESNSISNQKAMLEEFAARQGFTNIVHFTDDGISGTCFDRPGFLAMMKEVEAGNVEYLCIKDMSRMGRDYLKVGQIMEILRQRGVRLIAINDGVDSARGDDDFTPFRNIMNDSLA